MVTPSSTLIASELPSPRLYPIMPGYFVIAMDLIMILLNLSELGNFTTLHSSLSHNSCQPHIASAFLWLIPFSHLTLIPCNNVSRPSLHLNRLFLHASYSSSSTNSPPPLLPPLPLWPGKMTYIALIRISNDFIVDVSSVALRLRRMNISQTNTESWSKSLGLGIKLREGD